MDSTAAYEQELAKLRREFALKFRRMREDKFSSQEKFGEHAKLHRTTVGSLEQGKTDPPLSTLLVLKDALDVSFDELLEGLPIPKERKPPPPPAGSGRLSRGSSSARLATAPTAARRRSSTA